MVVKEESEERGPVSVKFPSKLLKQIDYWIDKGAFDSRSELIKAAIRDKLKQLEMSDEYYEEKSKKIE